MIRMDAQLLIDKVISYDPKADIELLNKAFNFAKTAHIGQTRISGEPYIIHPVEVAIILAELELDIPTLCAALLHDVVEDTSITQEMLEEEFGEEIGLLVDGVTKLSRLEFKTKEDE